MSPSDPKNSEGLSASTRMPVAFQPRRDEIPSPFVPLLRRLIDIGGLGGAPEPEESDSDAGKPSEYLRRLHTKVDLLLWMGAELLAVHRPLPASCAVSLHADHLRVEADGTPEGGERQWLLLYCLDGLPMPLPLPVVVTRQEERLHCALDSPGDDTAELYSQLLFRLHRRAIAAARGATSTSNDQSR